MREFGKQSIHDHVVRLVAQRWNNPWKYNIAVNPGSEKNRWVGIESDQNYPDLIGWVRERNRDKAVWIAEVETGDTVTYEEATSQWRRYASLGLPFYLIVPKGYRASSIQVAGLAGVRTDGVYEYNFANNAFLLV